MKILFLTRRFWPEVGGVENHVGEISKRLVEMGNEVTIVCERNDEIASSQAPRNDGRILKQVQDDVRNGGKANAFDTIRTFRIPVGKNGKLKKFRIWRWLWKNRELIENADLVHVHDVGFWFWPFRLFFFNKPFFMTFHGWEEKYPIPLKNKIIRKISEKMARGNLCVGKYLEKWYGTKATYITYGGVQVRSLDPRVKPEDDKTKVILYLGRLDTEEIFMYLEALSFLRRPLAETLHYTAVSFRGKGDAFNTRMIVIGDGKRRKEAEEYAKKYHLAVEFKGEIKERKEIKENLKRADLIFANGYLSILEGLAAGKPIFSLFTNPVKKDYLEMTPFKDFINIAGNAEELVRQIKEPSTLSLRRAEEGYEWVKKQNWGKVTEIYLKLWKNE